MYYSIIQNTFIGLDKMLDLLNEPIEIQDPPNALELSPTNAKIKFKDVSFAYNPERPILKNICHSSFTNSRQNICANSILILSDIILKLSDTYNVV